MKWTYRSQKEILHADENRQTLGAHVVWQDLGRVAKAHDGPRSAVAAKEEEKEGDDGDPDRAALGVGKASRETGHHAEAEQHAGCRAEPQGAAAHPVDKLSGGERGNDYSQRG